MHEHGLALPRTGEERPRLEVAEIFRARGEVYRHTHALTPQQRVTMRAIETCRTAVLGGHVDVCDACGFRRPAYNSCRNRHCPKCQALAQARWIDERMATILPIPYFHAVFTMPHELGGLALVNRAAIFDLLFSSASRALLDLGRDPKRLGGLLGVTAVLHTWTRDLRWHVHLHCVVTGGGLSPGEDRWIPGRENYLFPVEVMGALFRGKFLDGLGDLRDRGELTFDGSCAELADSKAFADFKDALYRMDWVVYAKRPFAGPEQVFRYLGHYTHRIGVSNARLLAFDERGVCFRTKGDKKVTLEPDEFIRRFLQHVLPERFVRIRHYGLHAASNVKTRLATARRLLESAQTLMPSNASAIRGETTSRGDADVALTALPAPSSRASTHVAEVPTPRPTSQGAPDDVAVATVATVTQKDWRDLFKDLTGVDLSVCPHCGGRMLRHLNSLR